MPEPNNKPELLKRSLAGKINYREIALTTDKFDEKTRKLTVSFASQTPVFMYGDSEVLEVSEKAMDISRFEKSVMPVLFNHNRDEPIAAIQKIWIEGEKAYADIIFDDDEDSLKIMNKVKSGSVRGTSVGYRVQNYEIIQANNQSSDGIAGPAYIARKWEVLEFSIVTVPADPEVGAGRSVDNPELVPENISENKVRENKMATTEKTKEELEKELEEAKKACANAKKKSVEDSAAVAKRCEEIITICDDFKIDTATRNSYISNSEMSVDQVRAAVLESLKKNQKPVASTKRQEETLEVVKDAWDKRREVLADGLCLRSAVAIKNPVAGSDKARYMSVRDIAIELLERDGVKDARMMDPGEIFKRALTTSSSLSAVFDNVAHKSLAVGYPEADMTYKAWTNVGTLTDFKDATVYQISAAGEPKKIPEGGEFSNTKITAGKVTRKLETYGEGFTYTREMFIDDDLSVLTTVPRKINQAFERYKNYMCYQVLINGNYSTSHKTLLGTGTGITTDGLSNMKKLMKQQTDISSKAKLNLKPAFLLVPSALETVALQMIRSTTDPNGAISGITNIFMNSMAVISDAELDVSDIAFYMATARGAVEGVEVDYLNGVQTPTLETAPSFEVLGWKMRIYEDFGIKFLDDIGFVKNPGVKA